MKNLKIAIQKKGRLSQDSIELLKKAGLQFEYSDRSLIAKCTNFPLEILFFRADDIPEIVFDGTVDCGITGLNCIEEKGFALKKVEKLGFGKCHLAIATAVNNITNFSLQHKKIATSYPKILKKYLKKEKISAEIIELSGSVEIAPRLNIANAVCDLVSSGSTLQANNLQEIKNIFSSEAILVTKKVLSKIKQDIFAKFLMRIRSTLGAKKYKYVMMNAPKKALERIKKTVPGLKSPTVSNLAGSDFISIASVIEEDRFWETIEKLKSAGASGILVLPIEKLIF